MKYPLIKDHKTIDRRLDGSVTHGGRKYFTINTATMRGRNFSNFCKKQMSSDAARGKKGNEPVYNEYVEVSKRTQ